MSDELARLLAGLRPLTELEAMLAPRGIRARSLLEAYGIPVVDDHFSQPALARALAGGSTTPALPSRPRPRAPGDDAVQLAREVLKGAGVRVVAIEKKKGWHLTLAAEREPRVVVTAELDGEHDPRCAPVVIGDAPVRARLYFVKARHSGGAYFVASNVGDDAVAKLHMFVLLSERRIFVASSGVLAVFADAARGAAPDHDLRHVRFSPSDPDGPLRVWFPKGLTSFDLEVQLRDAQHQTILPMREAT